MPECYRGTLAAVGGSLATLELQRHADDESLGLHVGCILRRYEDDPLDDAAGDPVADRDADVLDRLPLDADFELRAWDVMSGRELAGFVTMQAWIAHGVCTAGLELPARHRIEEGLAASAHCVRRRRRACA